ncbi:MAG TPA: acetylornithine deacetylase [Rhizobium sp.]
MNDEVLPFLDKLIAFPSVSADGNIALIRWLEARLSSFGVASRLTFDDGGGKANLFATIGNGEGGLILSGHTDVVPVAGQTWASDPFTAVRRGDRVFGRGACDMKGYIAVALSLVPDLVAHPSGQPVHFAFSYDEEIGCIGVRRMLADLATLPARPRGCIVGEPTGMHAVVGHKGAGMYKVRITGRAAHSSLAPYGVNAIQHAARIIERCRLIADRLKSHEKRHMGYDVPYSTIQVNKITGGTGGNIVADNCEFLVDIRSLASTSQAALLEEIRVFAETELLPEMRSIAAEAAIEITQVGDVPAFDAATNSELVTLLRAHGGKDCRHVAFGTEAGLFERAGIPTLICGPGSIEQAHKPDEFVEIDQLVACDRMLRGIFALPSS